MKRDDLPWYVATAGATLLIPVVLAVAWMNAGM